MADLLGLTTVDVVGPTQSEELVPAPTKAHDGRTMISAVVLTRDHTSVAVNTGAWVLPLDSPETARRVLTQRLRRAVIAWQPAEQLSVPAELTGERPRSWETTAIALPEVVGEVVASGLRATGRGRTCGG